MSSGGELELRPDRRRWWLHKGVARLSFEPLRLPRGAVVERLDLELVCHDVAGTDRVFERTVAVVSRPRSQGWGILNVGRQDPWPSAPSARAYGGTAGFHAGPTQFTRPLGLLIVVETEADHALPAIDAGLLQVTYRIDRQGDAQRFREQAKFN